jgi:hypothetical protein
MEDTRGVELIVSLRAKGEKSDSAIKAAYKSEIGSVKNYAKDSKAAKSVIAEYFQKNMEELSADVSMHLWDLYAKNYKLQDYRECRAILKQITDLTQTVGEVAQPIAKEPSPILKAIFDHPKKAQNE